MKPTVIAWLNERHAMATGTLAGWREDWAIYAMQKTGEEFPTDAAWRERNMRMCSNEIAYWEREVEMSRAAIHLLEVAP